MTAADIVDVHLAVDTPGQEGSFEAVPAVAAGEGRYRILASPGFAPGTAAGDIIELDVNRKGHFKVVERSGNICIQVFFANPDQEDRKRVLERATALIRSIGGWLDGGMDAKSSHLVIYTVPASVDFPAIEGAIAEMSKEPTFDSWMYGNVYDEDGVTPLNWWK
jgi:hypothetical protein